MSLVHSIGGVYYQERELDVKSTHERSKSFFCFEGLSEANYKFWSDFLHEQETADRPSDGNKLVDIKDGLVAFSKSLEVSNPFAKPRFDTWIAYANREQPVQELKNGAQPHSPDDSIEMVMCVFAQHGIPITTHIGIFRTVGYWDPAMKPRSCLAMELHKFAAFMSTLLYPEARYMVTKPVRLMRDILVSALLPIDAITVGSISDRRTFDEKTDGRRGNYEPSLSRAWYVPKYGLDPFPVDDSTQQWSVRIDGEDVSFDEPAWISKHEHLMRRRANGLTVIVDVARLASMWSIHDTTGPSFGQGLRPACRWI
jgi:hypothetical protein